MSQLHIAALGSSFIAGPGISPEVDDTAKRSGNNYPSLAARALNARLTDLSSSGATLLNILSEPQRFLASEVSPQLDRLPPDVDIVLVTAGGNDIGYSGEMIGDAAKATLKDLEQLKNFLRLMGMSEDSPIGATGVSFEEVTDRFTKVIDRVHSVAPKAKIYLVEYIAVFGADTKIQPDQPIGEERVAYHREVAGRLSKAYQDAAAARPDRVAALPINEFSKGHAMGSGEPWIVGFTLEMLSAAGEAPYHPNGKGHAAVAEEIVRRIKADA